MPALGADMESGILAEWLVKPGDSVRPGDIVCVVETQKGAIEVEIFETGRIAELVVHVGEEVPVGALLARLDGPAGTEPVRPAPTPAPAVAPPAASPADAVEPVRPGGGAPHAAAEPAPHQRPPQPTVARRPVSPAARRRARELGLDPERLASTGIDGSVTLADVEAAAREPKRAATPAVAPAAKPATAPRRGFDAGEMRKAIAAAMQRAKREIPHYYLGQTVDFAAAEAWLLATNRDRAPPERLLPAVLLLKAAALALGEVPELNGTYEDGGFRPGPGIHVGWAISLRGGGLVAPAIRDADRLGLDALMTALRDLVQRARAGGLRASELASGTFTVTSVGERGAEAVTGVIYPPQVAILGAGRIARRPWVVGDQVVPRPVLTLTLAADHRVTDGHKGGRYLAAIDRLLQEPEKL